METAVVERRRHPRLLAEQSPWRQMRLRTGDPLVIVDIGGGGVLVESRRRLLPGTAVTVHLTGRDRAMSVEARILRCAVCALEPVGGVRYRGALEFCASGGEVVL